ncbi:hypothetical protein BDV96DRAFT_359004 [Lophiotrema nucula]|uniref:F-box domain-containing protein n=1 Tax=Lophiotrema nucula TaxID=690887 RepID=A0A6A5YEU7_9PLEO|nr:hypothetical protein BDV96DRAFT_359004 [Lophiotrema nucula]
MDQAQSKLAPLELLPLELLLPIIDDLLETKDTLKLALTSKWMNHVCNKHLYRSFEYIIRTPEQDKLFGNFLRALENQPSARQYVKEITIDERALIPLQGLAFDYPAQLNDDLTYDAYKDVVAGLRVPNNLRRSAMEAAELRLRLGGLLSLCKGLTNLHISLCESDSVFSSQDYASVLAPLTRTTFGPTSQPSHLFPRLTTLSLDLSSCKMSATHLYHLRGILTLPSLRTAMLTFPTLGNLYTNGETKLTSSIEELHLQMTASRNVILPGFLGCCTNLKTFTYRIVGRESFTWNPSLVLQNSAQTLQMVDLCADIPFSFWDTVYNEGDVLDFRDYHSLRTLLIPLPHPCRQPQPELTRRQRVQKLADALTRVLPASLDKVSFYMAADLTYRVPIYSSLCDVALFNKCGEHLLWSCLRQRLGLTPVDLDTSQALTAMGNGLNSLRGSTLYPSDAMVMASWDWLRGKTSCDCEELCKDVWEAAAPHFPHLKQVELLHFETERASRSRRYGKTERMYRTGAERGITIWTR